MPESNQEAQEGISEQMQALKEQVDISSENNEFEEKQIVVFKLGQEEFGVDINIVRDLIKISDITRIPNSQPHIKGLINLRGKIIVVLSLGVKLSFDEKEYDKETRIVVVEMGTSMIGMIVDECNEVMRIPKDKIENAPKIITQKINANYIEGVGVIDDRLIILLDLPKVIGIDNKIDENEKISADA